VEASRLRAADPAIEEQPTELGDDRRHRGADDRGLHGGHEDREEQGPPTTRAAPRGARGKAGLGRSRARRDATLRAGQGRSRRRTVTVVDSARRSGPTRSRSRARRGGQGEPCSHWSRSSSPGVLWNERRWCGTSRAAVARASRRAPVRQPVEVQGRGTSPDAHALEEHRVHTVPRVRRSVVCGRRSVPGRACTPSASGAVARVKAA
jgi:hypothetical protein